MQRLLQDNLFLSLLFLIASSCPRQWNTALQLYPGVPQFCLALILSKTLQLPPALPFPLTAGGVLICDTILTFRTQVRKFAPKCLWTPAQYPRNLSSFSRLWRRVITLFSISCWALEKPGNSCTSHCASKAQNKKSHQIKSEPSLWQLGRYVWSASLATQHLRNLLAMLASLANVCTSLEGSELWPYWTWPVVTLLSFLSRPTACWWDTGVLFSNARLWNHTLDLKWSSNIYNLKWLWEFLLW